MDLLLEILKITIPGALVFLATYLTQKKMFENEDRKRLYELKKRTAKKLTPVKLTAYERLALLLERISLESMIIRINRPGMTAMDLHSAMLATIREEFEHNVTQQIYVSSELWLVIKNARERLVQFINMYASQAPADISSIDFAKVLIEEYNKEPDSPIDIAMRMLKNEVKSLG